MRLNPASKSANASWHVCPTGTRCSRGFRSRRGFMAIQRLHRCSKMDRRSGSTRRRTWQIAESRLRARSPEMTATTDGRPWGLNNPHWRLFAFGPFNHSYVAVWVADNPADNDADPLADGTAPTNPGAGIVALRSEAFGVGGAHKVLESTFHRVSGPVDIGRLSWAQVW